MRNFNIRTSQTLLNKLKESTNDSAWNRFYGLYSPVILGFLRKRGLDQSSAEDILQETMCELVHCLPKFEYRPEKGRFSTYLCTIVRGTMSKRLRRIKGIEIPLKDSPGSQKFDIPDLYRPEFFDAFNENYKKKLMQKALSRVKKRVEPLTWKSFQLFVLDGKKSANEVAAELGVQDRNSIYQHKKRMISLLRDEIKNLENVIGELGEQEFWERRDYSDQRFKTLILEPEQPGAKVTKRINLLRKALKNHPTPPGSSPKFLILTKGNSRWIDITDEFYIGSATRNNLILRSSYISRRHCLVFLKKETWLIKNLQSTNGLFVNGQKVFEKTLDNGDIVQLGDSTLILVLQDL